MIEGLGRRMLDKFSVAPPWLVRSVCCVSGVKSAFKEITSKGKGKKSKSKAADTEFSMVTSAIVNARYWVPKGIYKFGEQKQAEWCPEFTEVKCGKSGKISLAGKDGQVWVRHRLYDPAYEAVVPHPPLQQDDGGVGVVGLCNQGLQSVSSAVEQVSVDAWEVYSGGEGMADRISYCYKQMDQLNMMGPSWKKRIEVYSGRGDEDRLLVVTTALASINEVPWFGISR